VAPMNGMNGMCPECGIELAPGARFCPRCGGFAGVAAPGPAPGGQPTVTQQPQWPGGPGRTVAAPAPGRGMRAPRAALPAALPAAASDGPPQAEPPVDPRLADWSAPPTVTRQPSYPQSPPPFQPPRPPSPQSFQPFEQPPFQPPSPPPGAEPTRYQAPLPPDGPPPGGYPAAGYGPAGYPRDGFGPGGYEPTEFTPGGYQQNGYPPQDGFAPTEFTPRGRPQNGYPPAEYPPAGPPQDGCAPPEFTPRGRPLDGYQPMPAGGQGSFEPSPAYPGRPPDGPDGPDARPETPRQPPRRHDRGRRGVPLALWVVLIVLLAGGAGVAFKFLHHSPGKAGTGTAAGAPAGAGASGSASGTAAPGGSASPGAASGTASAATERQAAADVAALLSRSAADRTATNAAANDVASCGPNLKTDPAAFGQAVSSRKALLAKLAAVPGRAALPPALITDLTGAWQASIAADQAYTRWANDELAKQCVPNDTADPGFAATVTPNQQATTDKTQFAAAWNAVAAKYGLTKYQPGQL
jgi:hypothetical protein